jgi:hypothetical protein
MNISTRWIMSLVSAGAIGGCASAPTVQVPDTEVAARMRLDLNYLASPLLMGRLTGTPGNDSAAAYIARRYAQLGLQPIFGSASCQDTSGCQKSFLEPFRVPAGRVNELDVRIRAQTQNVGALVRGTDSILRDEYVVVGAHYDHLGQSSVYALDSSAFRRVHLGADDNASGTVAVMELARRLAAYPARRSVLFANFSAEELGLIGSGVFVHNIPVPIDEVITMVNLDMVGRLRQNRLVLHTAGADNRFHAIVDSVEKIAPAISFHLIWKRAVDEASDQLSFADAHVPVFSPFTELHADYHRFTDVADRINFAGMEKVVDLTERVIRAVADGDSRPALAP